MSDPSPAIVLLAAGTSTRFGALKQLHRFHGVPLVRRAALAALDTGLPVWIVTGAHAERVEEAVAGLPLRVVHNAAWAQGMGGSLALGVREAAASAVLVMLADQPLVTTENLKELLAQHGADPKTIVAADYGEVLGPPCLFPAEFFAELEALHGDRGARALFKQHPERVQRVPMPRAAVDVDTPADLARLEAMASGSGHEPPTR